MIDKINTKHRTKINYKWVIINKKDATRYDLHPEDRVIVKKNGKKIKAIVDVAAESSNTIKLGQIGLFYESSIELSAKRNDVVSISLAEISHKHNGDIAYRFLGETILNKPSERRVYYTPRFHNTWEEAREFLAEEQRFCIERAEEDLKKQKAHLATKMALRSK